MTVEASVPPETGNVTYVWYINGDALATGASYTTPSDLIVGVYKLDVISFTADGSRAGSTTYTFRILNLAPVDVTLEWGPILNQILPATTFTGGTQVETIRLQLMSETLQNTLLQV